MRDETRKKQGGTEECLMEIEWTWDVEGIMGQADWNGLC